MTQLTRIKNNQITDYTIAGDKLQDDLVYGSNLTVTGNLTVNGTTTTVNTDNLIVEDPLIVLGSGQTTATYDLGIIGDRGSSEDNVAMYWDEDTDKWTFAFSTADGGSPVDLSPSNYANVEMNGLEVHAAIDMNSANKIVNLATPTLDYDAATKKYVDDTIGTNAVLDIDGDDSSVVSITLASGDLQVLGGTNITTDVTADGDNGVITVNLDDSITLTGSATVGTALDVGGATTFNDDVTVTGGTGIVFTIADGASTDLFVVDTENDTITMEGTISAGDNKINNVATPSANSDAANKGYVDDAIDTSWASATMDFYGDDSTLVTHTLVTDDIRVTGGPNITAYMTSDTNLTIINIDLDDNVTLAGNLEVDGEATLASAKVEDIGNTQVVFVNSASGDLAGSDDLIFTGRALTAYDLNVTTNIDTATLVTSGAATIGSTLDVTGAATFSDDVIMEGGAGNDFLIYGGDSSVVFQVAGEDGDTTIAGALDVNGATTMGDLTIDAASTINMGSNIVSGVATPSAGTDAANKQYVLDQIGLNAVLTIDADDSTELEVVLSTDQLKIVGGTNITTDVTAGVNEGIITVDLDDNVNLAGTLDVAGLSSLDGGINVDDNFVVDGASGAVTIYDDFTMIGGTGDVFSIQDGAAGTVFEVNSETQAVTINTSTTGGVTITTNGDEATSVHIDDIEIYGNHIVTDSSTSTIVIDPYPSGSGGSVIVQGDLTVTGTQTIVNSVVVEIDDAMMVLGTTADNTLDRGIKYLYDGVDSSTSDGFFGVDLTGSTDPTAQEFRFIPDATDVNGHVSGSLGKAAFGSMRVTDLTDNRLVIVGASGELEDDERLTFDGTNFIINDGASTDLFVVDVVDDEITMNGTISVSGNKIEDVASPDAGTDAANKAYVDSQVGGAVSWTITDGSHPQTIDNSDTLNVSGTANEVTVDTSVDDTLTIGLPDDVVIADTLSVVGESTFGASVTIEGSASAGDTELFTILSGDSGIVFQVDSYDGGTEINGAVDINGSAAIDNITIDGNDITANAGTEITINDAGADLNFRVEGDTETNLLFVEGTSGVESVNVMTGTATAGADFKVGGTSSCILSSGDTGERPGTPVAGMIRFHDGVNRYEYYDGSDWVDLNGPFTQIESEQFEGDGSTTDFAIDGDYTTDSCIVFLNGVGQCPDDAYTIDAGSPYVLSFIEAPDDGALIEVRKLALTYNLADSTIDGGEY